MRKNVLNNYQMAEGQMKTLTMNRDLQKILGIMSGMALIAYPMEFELNVPSWLRLITSLLCGVALALDIGFLELKKSYKLILVLIVLCVAVYFGFTNNGFNLRGIMHL